MDKFQKIMILDIHFLFGNMEQPWLVVSGTHCMLLPLETWQTISYKVALNTVVIHLWLYSLFISTL